ncbi:MAG: pilus assembly protein PilM [Patescibacteria group bacterium]|nr:pilus assembly protein PilM [Patescibacteria group bacterium]
MFENILGGKGINFSLSKFFKKKEGSFLGLDIGGSAIKIVQLKKSKGGAVLETYGELALGPYANVESGKSTNLTNKQISGAILDLLKESTVNVMSCGSSIPLSSSLIFEMEIPRVSNDQLEKIVPIEARRFIPVPITEVMLDWRVVIEDEEPEEDSLEDMRPATETEKTKSKSKNTMKIFVVAIHKNAIERYNDIIKNAKLGLDFLEIEIFSTIRSVLGHNAGVSTILDIGSSVTKLYIVEYGVVKKSHLINRGSQDISAAISRTVGISIEKAEKKKRSIGLTGEGPDKEVSDIVLTNLKYIFEETQKVLINFQSEQGKSVDTVVFTGGGSVIKGLTESSLKHLEIESVLADPFEKIKTPAFLDDILKEIGPEFAVAVGLALRGLEK